MKTEGGPQVRSIAVTAAVAASLTLTGPAFADADIKFPDEHAACVAQAWVPANTSPDEQPGDLAAFIRDFAHTGEWGHVIRQEGCKP
jgi:hypothetical protein